MNSKTASVAITAVVLVGAAFHFSAGSESDAATPKFTKSAKDYVAPNCGPTKKGKATKKKSTDEKLRKSAQKGLDFLMASTSEWQERNNCFGCHVQGVAGEALTVGLDHQYTVSSHNKELILKGILEINGGLRTETGHAAKNGHLRPSARAYGGAAIARYDQLIGQEYSDDLLTAAKDLFEAQIDSGAVSPAHTNPPVSKGEIQTTYLAIQTWRQAYERSADERWLTAIANGERFLQNQVDAWYKTPTEDVQLMNYAMLGLVNAGVGSTEQVILDLKSRILEKQQKDGSWKEPQQGKDALTTGQSIYALRHVGMNDSDDAVQRGISYLLKHQQKDGGWSDGGSEKAAAMWAVLGLVATDIMSLNVTGLKSGQHVSGMQTLAATVKDNEGHGVQKVEVAIDDVLVSGKCGAKIDFAWNTKGLSRGMHTVDFIATSKAGTQSKRRVTVYAGNHFLTNLGTRYERGKTVVSVRDIASKKMKHTVAVNIYESKNDLPGKKVFSKSVPGIQGALAFNWDGKDVKGGKVKGREFIAEVMFQDAKGRRLHVEKLPFVHDSMEAQQRDYAEMSGRISFDGDEDAEMANAEVELLDDKGNVVQSVRSTRSGKYKFRNLKDGKKYRVRAKKKGFKTEAREVKADKAAPASANFGL